MFIVNVLDLINVTSNQMLIAGGDAYRTVNEGGCSDQITTEGPKLLGADPDFLNRRSILPLNLTNCAPKCLFTHEISVSPPKKKANSWSKRRTIGNIRYI